MGEARGRRLTAPVRVIDTVIPMRDGVRLAADVAVPDDGERHPILLVRSPYSRQSLRETHDPIGHARNGWAVVLQDVRGRFDSEGEFSPFHQEIDDGADTVAWCAAQPWSDGRVAMTGASYNGATQWLAAMARPPALKALAPVVTATNYRDELFSIGGAPEHAFPAGWAFMLAATRPKIAKSELRSMIKMAEDWSALLRLPPGNETLAARLPDYARWSDLADRDYWRRIDASRAHQRIDVPAYHLGGWYDLFCEGTLNTYVGMTSSAATERARRSQRLVVGPWTHSGLFLQAAAEVDFGIHAVGAMAGLPAEMWDFLAAAVEGRDVPTGAKVFVMGENRWHEFPRWPLPCEPTTFYLSATTAANGVGGDGTLATSAPERGCDSWLHDPRNPVPNRGGRTLQPVLPPAGPMDQRPVEERDDVLVYTSQPLRRGLRVIGNIVADLTVASTGDRADVTVKLCDVHPDGRSINIVDSIRRSDFTPGRPRRIRVDVGSTAHRFNRGHRIRVEVASSNFPRFACLPEARQTILYGTARPSLITLPVA